MGECNERDVSGDGALGNHDRAEPVPRGSLAKKSLEAIRPRIDREAAVAGREPRRVDTDAVKSFEVGVARCSPRAAQVEVDAEETGASRILGVNCGPAKESRLAADEDRRAAEGGTVSRR